MRDAKPQKPIPQHVSFRSYFISKRLPISQEGSLENELRKQLHQERSGFANLTMRSVKQRDRCHRGPRVIRNICDNSKPRFFLSPTTKTPRNISVVSSEVRKSLNTENKTVKFVKNLQRFYKVSEVSVSKRGVLVAIAFCHV